MVDPSPLIGTKSQLFPKIWFEGFPNIKIKVYKNKPGQFWEGSSSVSDSVGHHLRDRVHEGLRRLQPLHQLHLPWPTEPSQVTQVLSLWLFFHQWFEWVWCDVWWKHEIRLERGRDSLESCDFRFVCFLLSACGDVFTGCEDWHIRVAQEIKKLSEPPATAHGWFRVKGTHLGMDRFKFGFFGPQVPLDCC